MNTLLDVLTCLLKRLAPDLSSLLRAIRRPFRALKGEIAPELAFLLAEIA